jgi:hypothetical protein
MADVKISALPSASAITGTELVPIMQSSTTKQVAVSGLGFAPTASPTFTGVITFPDTKTQAIASFQSAYFERSNQLQGGNAVATGYYSPSATSGDRVTITIPDTIVAVNSTTYRNPTAVSKVLSTAGNWDASTYATAANRVGLDFYVYACKPASGYVPDYILSHSATFPSAMPSGGTPSATNTRKVGGFHCLGVGVGTIGGHTLTGYIAGDILPRSVWDIKHCPVSAPEGMVYSLTNQWVDIYLPSVSGSTVVSVYGGAIASGATGVKFHAYKWDRWFGQQGKKPIASMEFVVASLGANQSTNIAGSANPTTTGGHTDTAGRRMISNIGCEDMCGVFSQWGREQGAIPGASSLADAFDANDTGVGGQHYDAPTRPAFGGTWNDGVLCGSRSVVWNYSPLSLYSSYSSRGVAEPFYA